MQPGHFLAGRPNERDVHKNKGNGNGHDGDEPWWHTVVYRFVIRRKLFYVRVAIHLNAPLE
jgi:hypothetical protein